MLWGTPAGLQRLVRCNAAVPRKRWNDIEQSILVSRYCFVMLETSTAGAGGGGGGGLPTCALDGCAAAVVRRPGGGRPRLYCSDAHRAEARRRRLSSPGTSTPEALTGAGEGQGLGAARALLVEALARIDDVEAASPRDEVLVAAIRAEATEQVLRAQQAAADAARQAAAAEERLARERGEWQVTLGALVAERSEQARTIEELVGALEGVRAEFEAELLRHHADAARAESILESQRTAHDAELAQAASDIAELRQCLVDAVAAGEHADQRAARAEQTLAERAAAAVDLEVRAARAEEQSRQAAERLKEAKGDLDRLRRELGDERRHHRTVEAELRRQESRGGQGQGQVQGATTAGTARGRRRRSEASAPGAPTR